MGVTGAVRRGLKLLVVMLAVTMLAGCGGDVEIARPAVRSLAEALGVAGAQQVKLNGDEVSRLASQAGVETDTLKAAAKNADSAGLWASSVSHVRQLSEEARGQVRDAVVETVCDFLKDGLPRTQEDFYQLILDKGVALTQSEFSQVVDEANQFATDMVDAQNSADPNRQATVVLICYTAQTLK